MPRSFTATLLLEREWLPDLDVLADTVASRFPGIGRIGVLPGSRPGDTGHLTIDKAQVALDYHPQPVPAEQAQPPLKIGRRWDPDPAFRRHAAQVSVTCGGDLPGVEGAKAYAAATHFVAAVLADLAQAVAVLWGPARQLVDPREVHAAADGLLAGILPVTSWIAFAPVVPEAAVRTGVTGMVTFGLRPFIGREIELAPRPGNAQSAYRCLRAILHPIMRDSLALRDGLRLVDRAANLTHTVRERRHWLRRDGPVYVLVADDAAVDPATLRLRDRDVA